MEAQLASFGLFRLYPDQRQLKKGSKEVRLSRPSLDTLIVLVERAGEVVTQRELMSRVWPDAAVDEANLRVQIARLRKALGEGSRGARYIVTVPGRGYSFVAPVTFPVPEPEPSKEAAVSTRVKRLPPRLTRMIGRDDIVRVLSERLVTQRFVTIVGPGGIGKTTVANGIAHTLLDDFNGEVVFVDLTTLTDAALVPAAVASALGFMLQTEDQLLDLVNFLGDRKLLLVFDNCEHVIEIAAALAERITRETSQAHVLATSREALGAEGEHVHVLHALDCPPEATNLTAAEALKYPAVQLFMERAAASGSGAVLSDIDAPVVSTVCRRLDGIALAIELAASRAGSLRIRGIAELLDNRLVWHGRRTALPRHQTLNAMLNWSYNLLSEYEKAVLGRLSVFVGDFTLEAARFVSANEEMDEAVATEAIASLLAKSLISKAESFGSTYYRLLETTRSFAQAKLAERGEVNRVARRHAKFFSEFFQHDQLAQSRFGEHNLSKYAVYIGNVRAALQWAFSGDGDVILGIELAAWAAPLFVGLLLLDECGRWCELALAGLDGAARGTRQEMILQEALALSLMYTGGNIDQARVAIERGLALQEAWGDRRHKLQLLFGMYRLLVRLADFRGALAVAQQSAIFAEAAEDPSGLFIADYMLGTCHHFIGDQAVAQFFGERSTAHAAKPDASIPIFFGFDQRVIGPLTLARALWLRGFTDQACRLAKSSLGEALLSGIHPLTTVIALNYGSPVFLWSGDFGTADGYVARLIDYAGRHALEPFRLAGLGLKGALAVARDELADGIGVLRSALDILLATDRNLYPISLIMGALADGLRKSGQLEEALLTINRAIGRATDLGTKYDMAELLRIKAQILEAIPLYGRDPALNCLTEALEVAKAQSALALELRSAYTLAGWLRDSGQPKKARRALSSVYDRFTEGFELADLTRARQLIEELA